MTPSLGLLPMLFEQMDPMIGKLVNYYFKALSKCAFGKKLAEEVQ